MYATIVGLAIFISDLGTIFEFIGAFGFSISAFILPAIFYLVMTAKRESSGLKFKVDEYSRSTITINRIGSYLLIMLGLTNMILVVYKQV